MKKNIIQKSGTVKLPAVLAREIKDLTRRKKGAGVLAFTYEKTGLHDRDEKARRLRLCGKTLVYAENPVGEPVLVSAMRCGLRLCPSCSWERSRRIFENVYSVISDREFSGKQFIFLTLTIRNCSGGSLNTEIGRLLTGWHKINRLHDFRRSFAGTFRALEVTYNPETKEYHPHLHALAAVEPGYFRKSNRDYISHERLVKFWREACELDYDPTVRIQRVRGSTGKQVAEVAKYTVKSAEYLNRPEVVETLDRALRGKRLVAYGGLFKAVRIRLDLPDEDVLPEAEFPRPTVEELLRNPYIRKIMLEWKMGSYRVSVVQPSGDPAEWLDPGRLAAEGLRRAAAGGQGGA